jgi:F-box/TPR repeat protein Pof3
VSWTEPLHYHLLLPSTPRSSPFDTNDFFSDVTGTPCTDADIEKIIEDYMLKEQKLCSLHTINLSKTGVTGAGVKLLVDNLPKLRSLTLDYCERISSRDIVDYAERKGIEVSMKMVSANIGSAGGKKVRYG